MNEIEQIVLNAIKKDKDYLNALKKQLKDTNPFTVAVKMQDDLKDVDKHRNLYDTILDQVDLYKIANSLNQKRPYNKKGAKE
ncbi:hypothetical protein [Flammeovirga aprica]|uniref:DUF1154 domain-containing protein n=1 Tax=Flammeovirga aprica JL-4 TaxID=694437 RepID=A0A7X9RT69_9BACT|nr:DUF1154 domain-containing protein [Flammeovirga aprica]NME66872.1 DUF1154 domain-containing protein [Flammeovirga aprica JL-4]